MDEINVLRNWQKLNRYIQRFQSSGVAVGFFFPASALKLDPVVYGGGSDKAIVDMYLLTNPAFNETFGFTRDKCLPFSRALWGSVSGGE